VLRVRIAVETASGDVRLVSEEERERLLRDPEIRRLAIKWTRMTGVADGTLILLRETSH
jgi:hypothetical protein